MKQFVGTQSVVLRREALLGAALLIAVLSCGREPTAPEASETGAVRWAHALAFQPLFPKVLQQVSGASSVVSFDHVHIVLRRVDGSVALDTVVAFPVGSDEITVSMNVRLAQSAPTTGEPMALTLDYRSAADVSVFHGGPVTVIVSPTVPGAGPPPPSTVTIPLTYTGPGASATSVRHHHRWSDVLLELQRLWPAG